MLDPTQLLWTRVAAAVCTALAAGAVYSCMRLRSRGQAAQAYVRTSGEILASGVDRPESHVSDDQTDATPIVRYRYVAGGILREGTRISFGGEGMTTATRAARRAARYPVGARVDVYVDPHDPAQAVLEPSPVANLAALVVFAATLAAIAAILIAHSVAGEVLTTAKGVPLFAFALPIVAFAVAVAGLSSFVHGRALVRAASGWPTTQGRVTRADIVEEWIEEERDDEHGSTRPRKIARYQPDLRYAYNVARRDYTGTEVSFGWRPVFSTREAAVASIAGYSPGKSVAVFYDPVDPAHAVLEPKNTAGSAAPLVLALIFGLFGAGMLAFFLTVGFNT